MLESLISAFERTPIAQLEGLSSAECERLGRLAFPVIATRASPTPESPSPKARRPLWLLIVAVAGAFVVCRPAAGVCDTAENCDGVNDTCPADQFQPNTTVCRSVAGVCDVTGRVLGLMPHPERHVLGWQHPRWTREGIKRVINGYYAPPPPTAPLS